ncbi:Dual specificity protein kinase lkh1 [Tolypocladium paradoxum]|uniref:Dual specificity protein kinase lkh1 n=1 Tax=Tolypocladium paradoxum TaxID=94208 RepID=A0A2S4KRK8_9HYPO|nr:Dual specificity protein kinase lkh1 [Tolypocladium paradoxum]
MSVQTHILDTRSTTSQPSVANRALRRSTLRQGSQPDAPRSEAMSTPTTALATLPPPFHCHQQQPSPPPHPHLHPHPHPHPHPWALRASSTTAVAHSASNTTATVADNPSAAPNYASTPTAARLLPLSPACSQPANAGYPTGSVTQPQSSQPEPSARDRRHLLDQHLGRSLSHSRSHHQLASPSAARPGDFCMSKMARGTVTATAPGPLDTPSRKRRRSREPDWNDFYRNGLPKEIIIINDTPEPEANTSRKITNGHVSAPVDAPAATLDHTLARQGPTRKRRRDDDPDTTGRTLDYHVQHVGSHTNTSIGSNQSSDGTNSAPYTTVPTSLSSNGQYEDVRVATPKRKRTRQQAANEAKRRDINGLGDGFFTYKPPPYPPKKAGDVRVRVIHDRHDRSNPKFDDDDGHYIVVPDADLTDRYRIDKLLGQGTFGKVVQARDRRLNELVAVKVIRSVQKYRDASRIELRVLATLKANDEENRNRCIHLRDCFDYRGHICIVMDLHRQSVFDFLKCNSFVPFPNSQIQSFALLHDLNLIHTDLKPENILLCDDSYQTFTYNRKIPSSSTNVNRQATQRRVLLDTEIRLIDFGSATFQDEYHSSVVSTRHYRAPEIILGLGWSFPCDIWSIGCILVEFFTGDALFQTHDNLEHLAMMEAVISSRIDTHLVQQVNKMSTRSGGNAASKFFKRLKLDYPTTETTRGSRRFVKAMKRLNDIIPSNSDFYRDFLDLLRKMFVYDPSRRITAKQALEHPWFRDVVTPDDGTEAAKIRLDRKRQKQEGARHAQCVG